MASGLVRWDPFAECGELRARLDRIFGELIPDDRERGWVPAVDVVRDDGDLVLRADVPGMAPEEVKIEVAHGGRSAADHSPHQGRRG